MQQRKAKPGKILLLSEASLNFMPSFYKQDCNFHNFSSLVVGYNLCGTGVTCVVLQKKALLCSKSGCGTNLSGFILGFPTYPVPSLTAFVLQEPVSLAQGWSCPQFNLHSPVIAVGFDLCDISEIPFPTVIDFK